MKPTIPILIIMFFSVGLLFGQDSEKTQGFSLAEAQEYALANNDSIKLAKIDEETANLQVKETRAIGLPQVNSSFGMKYFFDIPTQLLPDFISPSIYGILLKEGVQINSDPNTLEFGGMTPAQFGTNYNVTAEGSVNQLIFDGQFFVGLRASRGVKELSRTLRNTTEINVKTNIAKLYLQALVLGETKDLLLKNRAEIDKNIVEMTAMLKEGLVDQIDLDRLMLAKQRIDNQEKNIENAYTLMGLLLKLQMGFPIENDMVLTDKLDDHFNQSIDLLEMEANAKNRSEYQTLMVNRELQNLNVKRWQAGYLPQAVGFFSYSQNAYVNEFDQVGKGENWFPTTVAGVTLNVPIFDGLTKQAKIQQAKLDVERADISLHQFEQAVELQVEKAKSGYQLAQSELETEKANLDLAQRIYDRAKILYTEGMGSSFELTTALSDLYTAQSAYLQASYKLITSQINLQNALGQYN